MTHVDDALGGDVESDAARGRPGADRSLDRYLQAHEAAARSGVALFRRIARTHSDRGHAEELRLLTGEIEDDHGTLCSIMRARGTRRSIALGLASLAGERISRAKPNGRLVGRSPLSDLIELEAAVDAVYAKSTGWRALLTAGCEPRTELEQLARRAEDQLRRLKRVHRVVADAVLS